MWGCEIGNFPDILGRNSVKPLGSLLWTWAGGRLLSIKFIALAAAVAAAAVALFQINRSNQVAIDSGQLMTQTAVAGGRCVGDRPRRKSIIYPNFWHPPPTPSGLEQISADILLFSAFWVPPLNTVWMLYVEVPWLWGWEQSKRKAHFETPSIFVARFNRSTVH